MSRNEDEIAYLRHKLKSAEDRIAWELERNAIIQKELDMLRAQLAKPITEYIRNFAMPSPIILTTEHTGTSPAE